MGTVENEKYITFKRDEFLVWWQQEDIGGKTHHVEAPDRVMDAVVIRRQDLFASPCLATYANMISLVAKNHGDPEVSKELLAIADYFEDQAQLAAAEGYKLPDR